MSLRGVGREIVSVLLAAALGICHALSAQAQVKPAGEGETIALGFLSELSGQFAPNGKDCREGYETARTLYAPGDRVGAHRIRFIFGDNHGEAKAALSEFQKLLDRDKIWALVTNRSQVAMALNPLSRQKKLPLMGIAAHPDFTKENPYAYRFWPNAQLEGGYLAETMIAEGLKRTVAITLEDHYSASVSNGWEKRFKELGGEVVASDFIQNAESEVVPLITSFRTKQFDSIFINLGMDIGSSVRRVREQGFQQPIFANYWIQKHENVDAAGLMAVEGVKFVEANFDRPGFKTAVMKQFPNTTVTSMQLNCFVAGAFLLQALGQPEVTDRSSLLEALSKLKQISVPDGTMKVIDREAQHELFVRQIRNGVAVAVQ